MSGTTRCGSEAPPPAASADQGPAVARPGPNIASQPTVTASRGTPIQAGVAGTKWKAASAAADVVERTAAQAAAAQAAAASAKGAAAAAHAALAAGMVDEQEICSAAAVGKVPGAAESAVYSRCETVGEEAAAAAAKAAAAAISAAAEAASAAAAVAEAATGNDECQMSSHVEDFLVSQGLRVAVALEAAATAAATAADAATQVAVATTSQAAEKSSNAIAAAAQRCHEAAASAAASAVAAFSAAASSTVDSIASTAAAARAAIGEVTGAATQKLIEATKAFEDAIAAKTVALESALLWRESVKSNSEASGSRSSSSFLGHRLRSSSQFSSSSNRSRTRGRSSLLHYFSSDYEREGSQGGAPDVPFNGAGTPELTATAEGKLIGGAAVAAFLSDGKEPLLPHEYGLEVSGLFKGEEGTSQPEQPSNAAPVPTTDTLPRKDSVDAIVAAAAAEAAAYEALAAQQLHEQHEFSGSFSRFGSLCESPPVAAPAAEAGAPASTRLRAAANATESNSPVASLTRTYLPEHEAETPARRAALAQTSRCEDTEVRQPQQRILQMQVRHTSALPNNLDELQEHEQLQVRHEPTLYSLGGKDCGKEWHRGNACEGESNSRVRSGCRNSSRDADLDRTTNTCFSPAASRRVSARCCLGSSLQLKVTCSAESGTGSGDSRKCRSLLECRLEDFLEQCTADQSEVSACSCGNCSSRWGVPGQPPFNLQFTQPLIGSAPPAEVVNSAHAVVGALSFYQGNDEGPVFASGLVDRTYLEHPHFSMPTISLLRQDISSSKVYGGDEDEIKRLVLLFPFACVSVTDLVMLMNCMEDPRVLTRLAGLEITASALEDAVSFTLLAEVLQHLQERGLLQSLLLLRIRGYSNADLRFSLSPEQQHRIHVLQQSVAGQFRPLRSESSAAFAATEAAASTERGVTLNGGRQRCRSRRTGRRRTGRHRSASSSKSVSNSNRRSSSSSRCSSSVRQPLYVPPLQLQRSLRALCRLLPQLRRIELLAPKAKANGDAAEGAYMHTGGRAAATSERPAFSKLSRVLAYVSPFAVLVQDLGFHLLSVKVTEVLPHCNSCYCQRVVPGSCDSNSSQCDDSTKSICNSSCCRTAFRRSKRGNCTRNVREGCVQPLNSTRTLSADTQQGDTTLHFSRGPASRSRTRNCCDDSPVSSPEEGNGAAEILKRTLCMSCDICVAPSHAAAAAATAGKQHSRRWFMLDSVAFWGTRHLDD